jgi:oxygen-independent coproporphyrinogen-3 oxidase
VAQVVDAGPDRLSVFSYAHLPDRFAPQRRIRAEDLPGDEDKLAILGACVRRLGEAGYVYIGMDHFARPDDELNRARAEGTLHRNFQGYSTHGHCDLVGMGVSAISQVHQCYSQNEKALDAYYAALDDGRLPVSRGIVPGRDDRIRSQIIHELMCFMRVDVDAIARRHGIDAMSYFRHELERLGAMESDGLLRLAESFTVEVTASGRFLVRAICMAFDRYLDRSGGNGGFSRVV